MDCANCQQRLPAHYYQQQFSPYTFQVGLDRVLYQASDVKAKYVHLQFQWSEGIIPMIPNHLLAIISNAVHLNTSLAAVNGFGGSQLDSTDYNG
ncbi:MAG: hypothetical protein R2788_11040 [Saprospiraceae bacterium]